ncbi:MAG TPA: MOSC domain-containing protein [Gemmatimonadales bacterium]|nr:MOSC domain-containing protein [Gemmatimonadales bacterium]
MTARVLSVQVGRPETHPVPAGAGDGEDDVQTFFRSAIAKRTVTGAVAVGQLGLEGDQVEDTRVHGGPDQAVLAYAAAHYPRWRMEWGRNDVTNGGFGENLTVDGLDELTVCLGDRWRIGTVLLEVTKPRSPCNRLAWYQGREDLIQRVRLTGRSGWYLRVLTPGQLSAGMPIELTERRCPDFTVRRAALAMAERTANPTAASALMQCEALAADWRLRLAKEGLQRMASA